MKKIIFILIICITTMFTACSKSETEPSLPPDTDITDKFTDPEFLNFLIDGNVSYDLNRDGKITIGEAKKITLMNGATYKSIKSLAGIEYCTNLTELNCYGNQITTLDLQKNTKLTDLSCGYNKLTTLDVSKNTKLISLGCRGNRLITLDVSKNTELGSLSCDDNQLTTLVVNKWLYDLDCGDNQLAKLDLSKNTGLGRLVCNNNQLTTLDLSKNKELVWLVCEENLLTELDLSNNIKLERLYCKNNPNLTIIKVKRGYRNNILLDYDSGVQIVEI